MAILDRECNCDAVIAMEQLGVGYPEILQYARAILSYNEIVVLAQGVEALLAEPFPCTPDPNDPTSEVVQPSVCHTP